MRKRRRALKLVELARIRTAAGARLAGRRRGKEFVLPKAKNAVSRSEFPF